MILSRDLSNSYCDLFEILTCCFGILSSIILNSMVVLFLIFKRHTHFKLDVSECFACVDVCVPWTCLVSAEARRGHRFPWN